jgi:hypothetical protein
MSAQVKKYEATLAEVRLPSNIHLPSVYQVAGF